MQKRRLGRSGLEVAPLTLGCNVFGWTADEATSFALLDAFVDAGLDLIDTADAYSRWVPGHTGGESETIIGRWLAKSGKRDRVLIATKGGLEMGPGEKGLSRAYLRRAVERSLQRLQTDRIDLYQPHRDDPDTPLEETLETLAELVREGKIRAIGASNYTAARLEQALAISAARGLPRFETLQVGYNLYDRAGFETDLADLCRREGLGTITYYGLASGFLTGKYRSEQDLAGRARAMAVKRMLDERGSRILAALDAVSAQLGATPTQVALAWLIARGVTAPIVSATNLVQFREQLPALTLRLEPEALAALDRASAWVSG